MDKRSTPKNWLLQQLDRDGRDSVSGLLKPVELSKGQVLQTPGELVTAVYFPEGALIGLISATSMGESVLTGMIGWDGALGAFEACGTRMSAFQAEVQVAGSAWRLAADDYRRLFHACEPLREAVHKYVEILLAESRQHVACNALHAVQARLARSLLEALERSGDGRTLPVTQEALAQMLGVQRTTVTAVMAELQSAGTLRSARGVVEVLDRSALERDACCCREAIQQARRQVYTAEAEVCD